MPDKTVLPTDEAISEAAMKRGTNAAYLCGFNEGAKWMRNAAEQSKHEGVIENERDVPLREMQRLSQRSLPNVGEPGEGVPARTNLVRCRNCGAIDVETEQAKHTVTLDQIFLIRSAIEKRLQRYDLTFSADEVTAWLAAAGITRE